MQLLGRSGGVGLCWWKLPQKFRLGVMGGGGGERSVVVLVGGDGGTVVGRNSSPYVPNTNLTSSLHSIYLD